jgi:hypothetical protein
VLLSVFAKASSVWTALPGYAQSSAWIVLITVVLIILVAFLTLWERKVIPVLANRLPMSSSFC